MENVNCYILDDDAMQSAVIVDYISSTEGFQIVGASQKPLEAIKFFAKDEDSVDLLFLDVEMPIMSGLEFLDSISFKGQVVLVTSNADYALDSYSYDVLDFLLKPLDYSRFQQTILKFEKTVVAHNQIKSNSIFLKVNNSLKKFTAEEILYCRGADDYVDVYTREKKYLASTSLTKLEQKLSPAQFMRIHRSIIVNTEAIEEIETTGVVIANEFLPVSKTYRKLLLDRIDVI